MLDKLTVINCKQGKTGQQLNSQLQDLGLNALWWPLQKIEPLTVSLNQQSFELVIFTSKNAVIHGLPQLATSTLQSAQIYAIGPATQALLQEHGLTASCADTSDSEALIAELSQLVVQAQKSLETVLIVKGHGGRDYIEKSLANQGVRVSTLNCYRRYTISAKQQQEFKSDIQHRPANAGIITNAESLTILAQLLSQASRPLNLIKLIVPSQRIAEIALNLGFTTVFVSPGPMNDAIINTLTQQLPNPI